MMQLDWPLVVMAVLLLDAMMALTIGDETIIPTTMMPTTTVAVQNDSVGDVGDQHRQQQQQEPYIFINGRSVAKLSNFTPNVILIPPSPANTTTVMALSGNPSSTWSANDCIDGQTYWDAKWQRCQRCTERCGAGAIQSQPCNRSHNLECICAKGWYMSMIDGQCKQCSECPPGYGMWRTCRWSRNTVCRQCQPGTYSGVTFGTLGCIPCSKCGPNQDMIAGCDGNRDTVCIDRSSLIGLDSNSIEEMGHRGHHHQLSAGDEEDDEDADDCDDDLGDCPKPSRIHFDPAIGGHRSSPAPIGSHPQTSGHGLPFYIALLVAVVFTFCLYALIQLRCNNLMVAIGHHHTSTSASLATRRRQQLGHSQHHSQHQHHHHNRLFGPGTGPPFQNHLYQHSNLSNSSHLLPPMYQAGATDGHLYRSPVFPPPTVDLFGVHPQQQHSPYHPPDSVMSLFTSKTIAGGGKKLYYC